MYKLFWPWQDEKEEAWLQSMSEAGWHLASVNLPCRYTFLKGEPARYIYRLDYVLKEKGKWDDYLQIFQDAGWEYVGELSNWQYWRKQSLKGETPEIFTDRESKLKKYQRMLGFAAFFMFFLIFMGMILYRRAAAPETPGWAAGIYLVGEILYAILIPIYVLVVIKILLRINQLKRRSI